jgi:hypothetical protein
MKSAMSVVVLVLLSVPWCAAQELPVGTILPVALSSHIRTEKASPGDRISGKLAQYVSVDGMRLPRGTELGGRIVDVQPRSAGSAARVALTFDSIRINGHDVPITTSLRALASMQAVFEAQLPSNMVDDYGSSFADWNTVQVGGQAVYRRDGTVTEGSTVVGKASTVGEVFGEPKTWPWLPCARDRSSDAVQSFWVFSTDACGLYGFDDVKLVHAGRSAPIGQIVLESPEILQIRAGSGLLLMVVANAQPPSMAKE